MFVAGAAITLAATLTVAYAAILVGVARLTR
jgi:hypothetical protein